MSVISRLTARLRAAEIGAHLDGWIESRVAGLPINSEGDPRPWITYGAINFLERRVTDDLTVFEYGSGQSTLWWASRVASIVSVEHDPTWYGDIRGRVPDNATVM